MRQKMKIAFMLYPTAKVKIDEDSSFWMMAELQARGHEIYHFESRELVGVAGSVWARLSPALLDRKKGYLASPPAEKAVDLGAFDCIFIRKEPPFDTQYLYSLQLLEQIKHRVFILNDPMGVALANEKSFCLKFPKLIPPTRVTQDPKEAEKFIRSLKTQAVVKPLDNKGGAGIFRTEANDKNLASLLAAATNAGQKTIMIQKYLTANKQGDKRVVILDGQILGGFLRIPSEKDFRANLSAGGTMHRATITSADKKMVKALWPEFKKYGLWFTGIDVIGGYLTEINVTSPAGLPEIQHYEKTQPEKRVADFIERRVRSFGRKR